MNIGQVGLNFNDSNFNNQIMVNFKRVGKNAVEIFSNLIYWSMQFNDCNFKIKLLQFKCLEVKWLDVNQPLYCEAPSRGKLILLFCFYLWIIFLVKLSEHLVTWEWMVEESRIKDLLFLDLFLEYECQEINKIYFNYKTLIDSWSYL